MVARKRPVPGDPAAAKPAAAKPTPKAAPDKPSAARADPPPKLAAGLADIDTAQAAGGSSSGPSAKAAAFVDGPMAATPDERPWEAAGPTGEAMLRLAAVHTACLALSDAAHHLRRTAVTVEAANAVALKRSLTAAKGDEGWILAIEGAERIMKGATDSFSRATEAALQLARHAGRSGPD